ncbi:Aste57867_18297 [Aphanomyces stellatus]|uniref:Aste57867_18297 protein n=1 Tax=Aphanomyces stellatus TaxID=120398 RepID=A0A485LB54_9STRA|nr:hypothetical protein As57867_018235 [Aphanomyces stellatus]VFT95034.1 Aste57867_18297 [Aphanomyces stellatus]
MPGAADASTAPPWLDQAKEDLTACPEWNILLNGIYDQIQDSLKRNHTKHFADLSVDERGVLMAQVELQLADEEVYQTFLKKMTRVVDHRIAQHVDSVFPRQHGTTKQTLAMDTAADAASHLVQDLPPEQKPLLRLLFNQPFPPSFRPRACFRPLTCLMRSMQAWKLFLSDTTTRFKYESQCATHRIGTISVLDTQLTQKAQVVLDGFPALSASRETLTSMKTALSYLHTLQSEVLASLGDAFFQLILPLLLVWPNPDTPLLVETYSAFLALPRPRLTPSMAPHGHGIVQDITTRLDAIDPTILATLMPLLVSSQTDSTSTSPWTTLLHPFVERLFVGVVAPETLLFMWDQLFLLGIERLLPELCAACLCLLRPQWTLCTSLQALVTCVTTFSMTIQVHQLQSWLEAHCATTLRRELQLEVSPDSFYDRFVAPAVSVPLNPDAETSSPPGSPVQAKDKSHDLINGWRPLLDDFQTLLTTVMTADASHFEREGDALLTQYMQEEQAKKATPPNPFAALLDAFGSTLSAGTSSTNEPFTTNADQFNDEAKAEEAFQLDLVQQSQKAAFGRTYSPDEIKALQGKPKQAYDKKLPKYTSTYTQKLAKARKPS